MNHFFREGEVVVDAGCFYLVPASEYEKVQGVATHRVQFGAES